MNFAVTFLSRLFALTRRSFRLTGLENVENQMPEGIRSKALMTVMEDVDDDLLMLDVT